jgi:hypothetical protein
MNLCLLSWLASLCWLSSTNTCWMFGLLYRRSCGQKNLRPILSIFGSLFGPKLLINVTTLTWGFTKCRINGPRVATWLPKLHGMLFLALGPIKGHKVQHLLVTWGRLKRIFLISALAPSVKPLGADFNFCTNRNAWFGLNIGPDS